MADVTDTAAVAASASPFPAQRRVIYQRSTLQEVICQVRFSQILRIDAELPAAFQEQVRGAFPLHLAPSDEPAVPVAAIGMPAIVHLNVTKQPRRFLSSDEAWTLGLASDFLALSTTRYQRWSDFQARLEPPLAALRELYAPQFFTRIGLRYRNLIRRSLLGTTLQWSELLQPHVAAALAAPGAEESIVEARQQVAFRLPSSGFVRLVHGLVDEQGESCYLLDADFFLEERIVDHATVIPKLLEFNRLAISLFRWCIADKLDELLEPTYPDA